MPPTYSRWLSVFILLSQNRYDSYSRSFGSCGVHSFSILRRVILHPVLMRTFGPGAYGVRLSQTAWITDFLFWLCFACSRFFVINYCNWYQWSLVFINIDRDRLFKNTLFFLYSLPHLIFRQLIPGFMIFQTIFLSLSQIWLWRSLKAIKKKV